MRLRTLPSPWTEDELLAIGATWHGSTLRSAPAAMDLTGSELGAYAREVPLLLRAVEQATGAFVCDPSIQRLFGYAPLQLRCILEEPGYLPNIPIGRIDSFWMGDHPCWLELNTDGAAGWHWSQALSDLWRSRAGLPIPQDSLPSRLLATLLRCFRQWDTQGIERPHIALVDWAEVGTSSEQDALVAFFERSGYPARRVDPRALRIRDGALLAGDDEIHLVYRRLVSEEAFARSQESSVILETCLDHRACMVGSFRTDPAWSKTFFVLLSDPTFEGIFSTEVLASLRRTVPWTRLVRPGPTNLDGRGPDLHKLLLSAPGAYLLKPARGFEGRGIVAGPYVSEERWSHTIHSAMASPGTWIAQAFQRPAPLELLGKKCVVQPGTYVLEGRLAGFLARASQDELIGPERDEWYLPSLYDPSLLSLETARTC